MQSTINPKNYNVRSIHLEVTGKCNLMCKYCYNSQFNDESRFSDEMSTDTIKKLVDEAKIMGCKRFVFSGGEPFTRPDIWELIEYCNGLQVEILSNASLLTEEMIKKLSEFKQVFAIKISLDGISTHDDTRLGSNHEDVVKKLKLLKKYGMNVVVNTEVTKHSMPDLIMLYNLLKEIEVDRWRVDLPFVLGRYKENYEELRLPDFEDFVAVVKEILIDYISNKPSFELELFNIYKSEYTPVNAIEFKYENHPCSYLNGSFSLRPNGDMIFCPSMDVPMSNFIKDGSLKKAIDKKFEHPFYDLKIQDIEECMNCRYINLCNAGCRVDALYYMGDYKQIDPVCCNLMPLIEKEIIPILPEDLKNFYEKLILSNKKMPQKRDINQLAYERCN